MRKIAIFIAVAALLLLGSTPAYANGIPGLPHAFYGSVTINGNPAPDGTEVSATVNIGDIISTQNPVTTVGGSYGIDNPYLLVQGYDIPDDATITFYVTNENGTATGGTTATFVAGGGPTPKNLSVTIEIEEEEEERPVSKGAAAAIYIDTNLFGTEKRFRIDSDGEIQETIEATSADGTLTITIPKGTIALDKDGDPLDSLEAEVDESPPDPPEDAYIIGLAYDFGPDGATFDPPITLEYTYDPDALLPEGVAEEDLVIAYYDEDDNEWVELDCVVDTENHTITASVEHFTTFAIIGEIRPAAFTLSSLVISPTEVAPGEKVNISISVANTGGMEGSSTVVLRINDVRGAEESVTIAAGSSQGVSFSVAKEEGGIYRVIVDGLSGSFTVVAPPPPKAPELVLAAFTISNLVISPAEADIGQNVTINLLVTNTGGLEGTYEVTLEINNLVVDTKEVTIAADASKMVTFTTSRDAAGTYTVASNGLSGSFKVKEAPTLAPPPEEEVPPTPWGLIGGIIGAVIVVALVILYFVRRRVV